MRVDDRLDVAALGEGLGEPLERRHEAEIVERRRPQLHREAPHVLKRLHDDLA